MLFKINVRTRTVLKPTIRQPESFETKYLGAQGFSAYEIAVQNGFEGTASEWLEFLRGADGTNGTNAPYLKIQWSADGATNWHDTRIETDFYRRESNDNGDTWHNIVYLADKTITDDLQTNYQNMINATNLFLVNNL